MRIDWRRPGGDGGEERRRIGGGEGDGIGVEHRGRRRGENGLDERPLGGPVPSPGPSATDAIRAVGEKGGEGVRVRRCAAA